MQEGLFWDGNPYGRSLNFENQAMPEVSVIMRVSRGGPFLAEAHASIRAQSFGDWELLLVDDGSLSGREAAHSIAQREARAVLISGASGCGAPMVAGCARARGEFLAILDEDDLAAPRRLELQLGYMKALPRLGLLGTAVAVIDGNGRPIGQEPLVATHADIFAMIPFVHVLRHSSVMVRRSLLEKVPYRAEFGFAEDWDFFARASENAETACLPELLCSYRRHDENKTVRTAHQNAVYAALVRLTTKRRRQGLPEELLVWKQRLQKAVEELEDRARIHAKLASLLSHEGAHELAILHAWESWRSEGGLRGGSCYLWHLLRGFAAQKPGLNPLVRAWFKEPAHQLLRKHGMPDRHQF